jgi:predicted nucleic acid-binding Zn ribbon protein
MSVVECPNCSSAVPPESRFCPECGRPLRAAEDNAARKFPFDAFLALVALVVIGGLTLFVRGDWAWGVAVVLLAGVLLLARREVERRRAARALASLRARATAASEAVAARSREQVELFRARRELAELDAQRGRAFYELGRAVFHEEEAGVHSARATVAAILERMREKEDEIERLRHETERRVERAQLQARPTERIEAGSDTVRVPETWPPPDEGDVPDPVATPPSPSEPAPTPDEPQPTRARRSK